MDSTFAPGGLNSLLTADHGLCLRWPGNNPGLRTLPSLSKVPPHSRDPTFLAFVSRVGNLPCIPTMDSTFACQGLYHHPSRTLPSQAKDSAFTRFASQLALSMVYTSYPEDSACAS
jgi:hypothetical protein